MAAISTKALQKTPGDTVLCDGGPVGNGQSGIACPQTHRAEHKRPLPSPDSTAQKFQQKGVEGLCLLKHRQVSAVIENV